MARESQLQVVLLEKESNVATYDPIRSCRSATHLASAGRRGRCRCERAGGGCSRRYNGGGYNVHNWAVSRRILPVGLEDGRVSGSARAGESGTVEDDSGIAGDEEEEKVMADLASNTSRASSAGAWLQWCPARGIACD